MSEKRHREDQKVFLRRGIESCWSKKSYKSNVRMKMEYFKECSRCKIVEILVNYKRVKKETKKTLNEGRTQDFDGLYQSLDAKEG